MLEQDYDESMDLEKAINLAMGIYLKTLDTQTLKYVHSILQVVMFF